MQFLKDRIALIGKFAEARKWANSVVHERVFSVSYTIKTHPIINE